MLEEKIFKFNDWYNRKLLRIVSLPPVRVCVCVCVCVCARAPAYMHAHSVPQYSLTLCDPVDCSLPGSSVHGIL